MQKSVVPVRCQRTKTLGKRSGKALTMVHSVFDYRRVRQVRIGAGVDRGLLQLRCRRIAERLQNDAKDPVVESTRRMSAIMDTGRCAVARRGVLAAAVVHSAK